DVPPAETDVVVEPRRPRPPLRERHDGRSDRAGGLDESLHPQDGAVDRDRLLELDELAELRAARPVPERHGIRADRRRDADDELDDDRDDDEDGPPDPATPHGGHFAHAKPAIRM